MSILCIINKCEVNSKFCMGPFLDLGRLLNENFTIKLKVRFIQMYVLVFFCFVKRSSLEKHEFVLP
jgi:hypothetical protein